MELLLEFDRKGGIMTKYQLEEFKTWILAQQSQILSKKINEGTFNPQYLSNFYTYYQNQPKRWELVIQGKETGTLRQEVVNEWKAQVDTREREREREQNNQGGQYAR